MDAHGHAAPTAASRSCGPRARTGRVGRRRGHAPAPARSSSTSAPRAAARRRIQAARGWGFPDQATADRFLEHSLRNAFDEGRWPAAWHSVEKGDEVAAMVGAAGRAEGYRDRGDLLGFAGSWQDADGARRTRDGVITLYSRSALDGPEASVPLLPSRGRGRDEWMVEYTFGRDGPREIAFRRAWPEAHGDRVAETVARLDLRDPANLASPGRCSPRASPGRRAPGRASAPCWTGSPPTASSSAPSSRRRRLHGRLGLGPRRLKFGAGGRKIAGPQAPRRGRRADRRLGERERFDCVDQAAGDRRRPRSRVRRGGRPGR